MEKQIKDLSGLKRTELTEALKNEMNIDVVRTLDQKGIESATEMFNISGRGFDKIAKIKFEFVCGNGYDYSGRTLVDSDGNTVYEF